eukprot:2516367-Rhodomonas_salina.1
MSVGEQEIRLMKEMGSHLPPGQRNSPDDKYKKQKEHLLELRINQVPCLLRVLPSFPACLH